MCAVLQIVIPDVAVLQFDRNLCDWAQTVSRYRPRPVVFHRVHIYRRSGREIRLSEKPQGLFSPAVVFEEFV